jgi:hypothetical protein
MVTAIKLFEDLLSLSKRSKIFTNRDISEQCKNTLMKRLTNRGIRSLCLSTGKKCPNCRGLD